MSDLLFITLGALLVLGGFVCCFVPAVSGPLLAFLGFLALRGVGAHTAPSAGALVAAGLFALAAMVVDYAGPVIGAKHFACSRLGITGSLVGTVVGVFFLPFGVVLGPYLGALAGELLARKPIGAALKGAFGAFLGYAAGLVFKLVCCAVIAVWFVLALGA